MSPSWTYWFSAESDFPCGHQGAFCENSVTALARSKYKLLSWFLVGRCIYGSFTNLSIFGRIGLPICPPGGILWKQRYRSSTFNIKVSFVIFGGKVYIWVRHEPINFRLIRTSHLATRGSNLKSQRWLFLLNGSADFNGKRGEKFSGGNTAVINVYIR